MCLSRGDAKCHGQSKRCTTLLACLFSRDDRPPSGPSPPDAPSPPFPSSVSPGPFGGPFPSGRLLGGGGSWAIHSLSWKYRRNCSSPCIRGEASGKSAVCPQKEAEVKLSGEVNAAPAPIRSQVATKNTGQAAHLSLQIAPLPVGHRHGCVAQLSKLPALQKRAPARFPPAPTLPRPPTKS
jgi:hypothetical protein